MPCFRLEQCDHRHACHADQRHTDEGPTVPQLRAFPILNLAPELLRRHATGCGRMRVTGRSPSMS